jgi:hypothetical protein
MPPQKRQALAQVFSFQPPVRGLILNEPLTSGKAGGALVLENWFPTATSIRTRGGSLKYATIGSNPVLRLWSFKSGQVEQFFASDLTHIYEITTPVDPNTPPAPKVSGQTSGYYSTAQFGTAGGNYLYAVNGTDSAQLYDGSTWKAITAVSTPAITGKATSTFSFVWSFASRLFFVEKDTMNAWYLPVDSIGGAANVFSLAGVFQAGGSLMFGGKWSLDAGNGLDDKCLFFSTEGEVAVYQGINPGSASDWSKVGVYKIAPPMGENATMSAGGDFLVATQDGIVPISEAVNKDAAALSLAAVTRTIEPEWKRRVEERPTLPWEILKWPTNNMMLVALPSADSSQPYMSLVANLETGAWAIYTGWDARCVGLFGSVGFFGTSTGTIHQMEASGSDDGTPYTCSYAGLPDQMRNAAIFKVIKSARATFLSNVPFKPKISASMNYKVNLPTPPNSTADFQVSLWDVGLWDVALWDAGTSISLTTKWVSIGRSGFAIQPQVQITCGVTPKPTTELIQFDVMYNAGGVMV